MQSKTNSILKAILFCVAFTILFILFSFSKNFLPSQFERLGHGILGTVAALLTTLIFLKVDKASFADIGLVWERKTIVRFLAGMLTGIVIMGALAAGVLYFSDVTVEGNVAGNVGSFLLMTLPLIPLALMEELGFRAYPLQMVQNKVGIRLAIIITSILFALYHIVNGWTIVSSFLGPAIWGMVFGLAAVYSNGIAMPTGLHYAANLTTAAFATNADSNSLWVVTPSPDATTKTSGINWSTILPALALLIFAIACLELYMKRRKTVNKFLPTTE